MGTMAEFNGSKGYLARPKEPGPGVLVLHEWWGLIDHFKEVCERLAREGYVALAPDLYRGRQTLDPEEAKELAAAFEAPEALELAKDALALLREHEAVEPKRVGVLGFSVGGRLALRLAKEAPVDAVVTFYGILEPEEDLKDLTCPVQGHFAQVDESYPADANVTFFAGLMERGARTEYFEYAGTEHSFFNPALPEVHDEEAEAEAWERTLEFLDFALRD